MFQRYSVRDELDGTCSIVDIFTGHPTYYFNRWLRHMPGEIARRAVITMNLIEAETQEMFDRKPPYS